MSYITTPKYTQSQGWIALGHLLHYLLFNGCIIAYFSFVQPHLLARLDAIPATRDVALGGGLIGLQALEAVGLWLKYPHVKRWVQQAPANSAFRAVGAFCVAVASMGHFAITLLIGFVIYDAFGLGDMPALLSVVFGIPFIILLLCKDIVLAVFLDRYTGQEAAACPMLRLGQRFPRLSAYVADWLLLCFSTVAYTISWGRIYVTPTPYPSPGYRLVEYFGAVLAFCLLYPATHPLSVAEAWMIQRPWLARLVSGITFLGIMLSAIVSVFIKQ